MSIDANIPRKGNKNNFQNLLQIYDHEGKPVEKKCPENPRFQYMNIFVQKGLSMVCLLILLHNIHTSRDFQKTTNI